MYIIQQIWSPWNTHLKKTSTAIQHKIHHKVFTKILKINPIEVKMEL